MNLLFYVEICVRNRNIPICVLGVLAQLCRIINKAVKNRLIEFKKLRDKYAISFGVVLRDKIIGHPFIYTGKCMKIVNIRDAMMTNNGIALLNVDPPLFSDEFLSHTRVAFTDVSLLGPKPSDFRFILFARNNPLLVIDARSEDWLCITPTKYIIHMNLPTRYNPITLGDPILSPDLLYFCFSEHIELFDDGSATIYNAVDFMISTFTQAIIRFKTISQDAYVWDRYGLTFNGETTSHPNTTSLVRPLTDLQ